jgi:hypothetical protein
MAKALLEETFCIPAAARKNLRFEIRTRETTGYRTLPPDAGGWVFSPLLGLRFRLRREEVRPGRWSYRLEHAES